MKIHFMPSRVTELFALFVLFVTAPCLTFGATDTKPTVLQSPQSSVRLEVTTGKIPEERFLIKEDGNWVPALSVSGSATRVISGAPAQTENCRIASAEKLQNPDRLLLRSLCRSGEVQQTLAGSAEPDVINVTVRFAPKDGAAIHSVEDRYTFSPGRHSEDTPLQGPLDFVWSQNLKNHPEDLIPHWGFKSPVVMMQQGKVFAALMPDLAAHFKMPQALDLDVTSEGKPWLSFGVIPSAPYGHSYFHRQPDAALTTENGTIEYSYAIVVSSQKPKLGYRRAVRRLWQTLGHPQLLDSADLQRNVRKPELTLFDDWRKEAWVRYAGQVYRAADCPGGGCGSLVSNRNYQGQWDHPEEDAWFNSWFQTLRTAYGWFLYGRKTHDPEIQRKAEGVLSLALKSPRREGVFSTIYLLKEHRWISEDGWAGFPDDYHAFCMSWTAYWMLKWGEDLTPQRKDEILAFTRPYGDFLVKRQLASGAIPSWYDSTLHPRKEFRDYNAETGGSALFLLELAQVSENTAYLEAATRAMDFITRETLPRQRWFDYETFQSCARKPFDFYDRFTAQYPQNNLSTIQAAMSYLALYRASKQQKWLDIGTQVLDYLLLTQQVWNGPSLAPKLLGGFATQNTDAEWSDARQSYAAVLLWDYYKETQDVEYLERSVAAARASFSVAPWENWAHMGYNNEPGALTGFHWGTGSAMTSVEIMSPMLADAFINIPREHGVGFNANSIRNLKIAGDSISFDIATMPQVHRLKVRFAGAYCTTSYELVIGHRKPVTVSGEKLERDGYVLDLSAEN